MIHISVNSAEMTTSSLEDIPRYIAVLPVHGAFDDSDRSDLRVALHNVLGATEFELLKPSETDRRLKSLIRGKTLQAFSPAQIADHLRVDGLLQIELTKQKRIYIAAYASYTVGVHLKLYSRKKNRDIWKFTGKRTKREGGITIDPFGLVATAVSSSLVLQDSVRLQLIDQIARKVVQQIPKPLALGNKRLGPKISSAHSNAADSPFKAGDEIQVQMRAEPQLRARVEIGNSAISFTLQESEEGQYTGRYIVGRQDDVDSGAISILSHRKHQQAVPWQLPGMVTIDNTAAAKVLLASGRLQGEQVMLGWQAPKDEKDVHYSITRSKRGNAGSTELALIASATYTDSSITPGAFYIYRIRVIDAAGNTGEAAEIRVATVKLGPTELPPLITTSRYLPAAGSPYIIRGETHIPRNVKLTIEAGAVIEADAGAVLKVDGQLQLLGKASAPIFIKSSDLAIKHSFNGGLSNDYHHTQFDGENILIDVDNAIVAFHHSRFKGSQLNSRGSHAKVIVADSLFEDGILGVSAHAGVVQLTRVEFDRLSTAIENDHAKLSIGQPEFGDNGIHVVSRSGVSLEAPIFRQDDYLAVLEKLQGDISIHWGADNSRSNLYYHWEQQQWREIIEHIQQQQWTLAGDGLQALQRSERSEDLLETLYKLQNPQSEAPGSGSGDKPMLKKLGELPAGHEAALIWLPYELSRSRNADSQMGRGQGFIHRYLNYYHAKSLASGVLTPNAFSFSPILEYPLPAEHGSLSLTDNTLLQRQLRKHGFVRMAEIIHRAGLFQPLYSRLCQTTTPWRLGKVEITPLTSFDRQQCFVLELSVSQNAKIYLFGHGARDEFIQLEPNGCNFHQLLSNRAKANQPLSIPQNSFQQPAVASHQQWPFERFFLVVALDSAPLAPLQQLITSATPVCQQTVEKRTVTADKIIKMLSIADIQSGGSIRWRQLTMPAE